MSDSAGSNSESATCRSVRRSAWMAALLLLPVVFQACGKSRESKGDAGKWISQPLAIPGGGKLTGIVFADNRFVAVGTQGLVFTSPDGEEWTSVRSGIAEDLTGVFHYHEELYDESMYRTFMAIGKSGAVYRSVEGSAWKRVIAPQSGVFHRIFRPAKEWFGTFQDSGVVLFSNGADTVPESWHRIWTGTRNRLTASALGRGLSVAVGTGGAVVALPDSVNFDNYRFELGHSPTQADLRAVAWGRDRFIAVGDSGTAVVSADGRAWIREAAGYGGTLHGIAFGAGKFIAIADDRILAKSLGPGPASDSSATFGDTWFGMWWTPENRALRLARFADENRDTGYFSKPVTPDGDWMETFLPAWGRNEDDFVPPGWGIMALDTGDLNRDGRKDLAFVLEVEDEALMNVGEHHDEPYLYSSRILAIAFGDSSGNAFRLVKRDDKFIATREDPNIDEPFNGLAISEDGVLSFNFHFWTSLGSWASYDYSYDFKYLDGDFTMVGAKSAGFMRHSIEDTWDYTYDLVAKRKTIIKVHDTEEGEPERTTTEDTLEVPEPIHFENFSDQWQGFE
jgi:hypothetical protein